MNEIGWPTIDSKHLIVDSKQMSQLENEMFSLGMPKEALMEKASIQISRWILKRKYLLQDGVTFLIGPGHNGGDGAVIARELFLKGYLVKIWCPFSLKRTLTINHVNYLTSIGVQKLSEPPDPNGKELWIDAIFGSNQKREVNKELLELFDRKTVNNFGKVISIDVPTGLCPDNGKPFSENAVKADFTLVIGLIKSGLIQDSALPFIGRLELIDIGVPKKQLLKLESNILKISYQDLNKIKLPLLPRNNSKYERGRTLLIAGSEKYPGAAYLAIKGAIASGAGFVSAILPELVARSIWQVAPEVVVKGIMKNDQNGNASIYSALKNVDLTCFDSIVLGPGIGIDIDDWHKSKDYFLKFKGLLILDADALNRISRSNFGSEFFQERDFKTWITPHISEFTRIFPEISGNNKMQLVINAAKKFDISILLKGANSIIGDDKNKWQLFDTDADTARAGLGDLLSGFLGGSAAIDIAHDKKINTESFAKYVLLHSYAASNCKKGSNAIEIANKLSELIRKIKSRQMS